MERRGMTVKGPDGSPHQVYHIDPSYERDIGLNSLRLCLFLTLPGPCDLQRLPKSRDESDLLDNSADRY